MEKERHPTLEPATTDVLMDQLRRVQADVEAADTRIDQVNNRDAQQAKSVVEISDVLSTRKVTDPNSEELGQRPNESISSKLVVSPIIGRLARRYSGLAGEENKYDEALESPRFEVSSKKFKVGVLTHLRDNLSARRVMRQRDRQERSIFTEKSYGTNIGRGSEAFFATRKKRVENWLAIRKQYKDGTITAVQRREMVRDRHTLTRERRKEITEEYEKGEINKSQHAEQVLKSDRVYTTTKAVRRSLRRERAGSVYSQVRTEQPVAKPIRKKQVSMAEARAVRAQERAARIQAQIDAERELDD